MRNIAEVFKRQTDSILRQTKQGPTGGGGVIVETSDGEESIYNPGMGGRNLAAHKISADHDGRYYTEEEIDQLLAAITIPGVGIVFRETFNDLQVWNVTHGLGGIPCVTIYKGTRYGFGTQPFGSSPFGGGVADFKVDFTPIIENIDDNNIRVTWIGNETGTVVCVG